MPDYTATAGGAVAACPQCGARSRDHVALYAPSGAPLAANGSPLQAPPADPPVARSRAKRAVPAPGQAAGPLPWQAPTQSIQFWQGLAAGLAVAIVILFLIALAA